MISVWYWWGVRAFSIAFQSIVMFQVLILIPYYCVLKYKWWENLFMWCFFTFYWFATVRIIAYLEFIIYWEIYLATIVFYNKWINWYIPLIFNFWILFLQYKVNAFFGIVFLLRCYNDFWNIGDEKAFKIHILQSLCQHKSSNLIF